MLDIQFIRDHAELVQQCATNKKFKVDIPSLLAIDTKRRELLQKIEGTKAEQNNLSKIIKNAAAEERPTLIQTANNLKTEISDLQPQLDATLEEYKTLMLSVPNIHRSDVPVGRDDSDNQMLRREGQVRNFSFKPKDHEELMLQNSMVDFDRGAKVSGSKQYFLKNDGALIEMALMRYAIDTLIEKGYSLIYPPVMVHKDAMIGTGWFPAGEDQVYFVEKDDLYLIGTSEVPLCAMYKDEILEESQLPLRLIGYSNCFRREAGTYGKDTRGLYRIHQFQKVEQVIICKNDEETSHQFHQEILSNSESIVQSLELPYQVVVVCSGDLGMGQVYKNDIETYMYSREGYCETHSCSTFYEFQARRLNIRYKDSKGKIHYCHTLNNTAIASPRFLIPLLEHHQNEDGSITIPNALKPYLFQKDRITGN